MIDNMPTLRKGAGSSPDRGGCLVQIANWLVDHQLWSDQPTHVNPVLRSWGINVNDRVGDDARRELALAAVRIAGTRSLGTEQDEQFARVARAIIHDVSVDALSEITGCGCGSCLTEVGGTPFDDLSDEAKVDRYFQIIDRYYEITGDTAPTFGDEVWAELAMAMRPKVSLRHPKRHAGVTANHWNVGIGSTNFIVTDQTISFTLNATYTLKIRVVMNSMQTVLERVKAAVAQTSVELQKGFTYDVGVEYDQSQFQTVWDEWSSKSIESPSTATMTFTGLPGEVAKVLLDDCPGATANPTGCYVQNNFMVSGDTVVQHVAPNKPAGAVYLQSNTQYTKCELKESKPPTVWHSGYPAAEAARKKTSAATKPPPRNEFKSLQVMSEEGWTNLGTVDTHLMEEFTAMAKKEVVSAAAFV